MKKRKKERNKYESHKNNLESALILQGERKLNLFTNLTLGYLQVTACANITEANCSLCYCLLFHRH